MGTYIAMALLCHIVQLALWLATKKTYNIVFEAITQDSHIFNGSEFESSSSLSGMRIEHSSQSK